MINLTTAKALGLDVPGNRRAVRQMGSNPKRLWSFTVVRDGKGCDGGIWKSRDEYDVE